jgi:hypothetical protein
MGILTSIPVIGKAFKALDKGLSIVDKFVPDKDKANELKHLLKLKFLELTKDDPLHTRQIIALTFHAFMWITKLWTGSFPQDTIMTYGETDVTIGIVYLAIIAFYYPVRALEKVFK